MKNSIYILLFSLISSVAIGQNDQGSITFERRSFWINISSQLPWMTEAELDRSKLAWGKNEGKWSREYELMFNSSESIFKQKDSENSMGWSRKDETFILSRNFENKTGRDLIDLGNKTYRVQGDLVRTKWKILNEIKEIEGFLCMKAMTTDPVKNVPVIAWFTDQIPVSGGPEGYGGLPGMILGLEIGPDGVFFEAVEINLDKEATFDFPKKPKGKKVSFEEYHEKSKKLIAKAMKNKKNPFWFIRY